MFKKWHKKRISCDFRTRFPFENARAVDYTVSQDLSEKVMLPKIKQLMKALEAGELDASNANVLDQLIFTPALVSACRHRVDHVHHLDSVHRIQCRYDADAGFMRREVAARVAALEDLKKEYARFLEEFSPERKENSNEEDL